MEVGHKTDNGKKRDHNEDSILVDSQRNIYVVADGMGGHKAGEMASRMAAEVAYEYLSVRVDDKTKPDVIDDYMKQALQRAHEAIKISSAHDPTLKGMGTTLVFTILKEGKAYICHAGDSRAYIIRNHIRQITEDQSLGNYYLSRKKLPKEKIPEKAWHTLTQAVGISEKIVPSLYHENLEENDLILLCTDGLTDMLTNEEIEQIVLENQNDLDKATQLLVDAANEKGGRDNISVVIVRYQKEDVNEFWKTSFSFG